MPVLTNAMLADVLRYNFVNIAIRGVTIAGPLPAELQNYTVYAAAVPAASAAREEARALIGSLTRAETGPTWRAAGLEPAGN